MQNQYKIFACLGFSNKNQFGNCASIERFKRKKRCSRSSKP